MVRDIPFILDFFKSHYTTQLGESEFRNMRLPWAHQSLCLENRLLKPANGPRLLLQEKPGRDVVILVHGLSDSPYYVQAIARRFYQQGCQVVMPLLPAHGLIDPDPVIKDELLDQKWRATIDHAVQTAALLGDRISIGGFSTGGALSLNRILRDPSHINGGLFLFSGALSIGSLAEVAGRLDFIQSITRITDGTVIGVGRDPYKYPMLPSFAGLELADIINENKELIEGKKVPLPVFAAHSVHDSTALLPGILQFMEKNVQEGVTVLISAQVTHANLPLEEDITLDTSEKLGPDAPPAANPLFDWMMTAAIQFFRDKIDQVDQGTPLETDG